MPRLRKPPDLAQLSMRAVARAACRALQRLQHQQYCTVAACAGPHGGGEEAALLMAVQLRDFVAEVPAHLADELVRHSIVLMDAAQVAPRGVGALLHPRCETLDLNEPALAACKPQVKFAVLQNVSVMPRLRHLDVKFCSPTGREHEEASTLAVRRVAEHLTRLHNLVSLDVSWVCTAAMLRVIAANCPRLQRLVAQDSRLERGDARLLSALTELRWLNVDSHHEPVTPADIAFLLRRLPLLAVLEYPDVEGVVATLTQEREANSFAIRDFSSALYRVNHELLANLNSLFPRLETLRLYKPAGELAVLSRFEALRILTVNECVPDMLTGFLKQSNAKLQDLTMHSVSPLTDVFTLGNLSMSRLRIIKLMGCKEVDLLALNGLCPELEELKLSQCEACDLSMSTANHARAFTRLLTVKVCGALQVSHLVLLLSSCHDVRRITVGAHATEDRVRHILTDTLWLELLRNNPMSRLEKLHLVSDRVSRRILDEMLVRLPSLATLYLTGHVWSHELAGDAIDRLKHTLRPFDIRLRIQGPGLYYFSYPEDS